MGAHVSESLYFPLPMLQSPRVFLAFELLNVYLE